MSRLFLKPQPDEKVILQMHPHWFTFARDAIRVFFLAAIPVAIFLLVRNGLGLELAAGSFGHTALVIGGAGYYLFIWTLLYGFWLDYYLDFYLVTDIRVVDIEQSGLFSRTIAEQPLQNVQDVTSEVRGFIPHLLGFGNVYIQTAGEKERFVFEDIPEPERVARLVLGLVHTANASRQASQETPEPAPKAS